MTAKFVLTTEASSWTKSAFVPAPLTTFELTDVTGKYNFQINTNGVFQNAQRLSAGTYIIDIIYIKA